MRLIPEYIRYVRELGNVISNCVHGVKYAVVGKDGVMEWKSQAGLLYADDVCLMANSEKDLKVIMEKVNECIVEYGLKVNEKKSKVVCINGKVGRCRWMMGDCCIGEIEEYKYLGITIEGGKHGRSNEGSKWIDRNGEICSRAIREQICDWKERMEDNDQADLWMWSTGMVPT